MALDIAGDRVQGVRSVVNPEKLGHLGPVADLSALLRRASRGQGAPRRRPSPLPFGDRGV